MKYIILPLILLLSACVPKEQLGYHLVAIGDEANPRYAIQFCDRMAGCNLLGYRFNTIAEAQPHIDWFQALNNKGEPKVLKIVQ